jgi:hypothetical protein
MTANSAGYRARKLENISTDWTKGEAWPKRECRDQSCTAAVGIVHVIMWCGDCWGHRKGIAIVSVGHSMFGNYHNKCRHCHNMCWILHVLDVIISV